MKFTNEFTVAAPLEQTWSTLLDVERVATCLPGAAIEPSTEDGVYRGSMRIKVGPVAMRYQGTVRIIDVDEDGRVATFEATGKESGGSGSAAAVIRNRMVPEGDGTKVSVETELKVTGRPAQFGRGVMQDVAGALLGQFAAELERRITSGEGAAAAAGANGASAPAAGASASTAPSAPGPSASASTAPALSAPAAGPVAAASPSGSPSTSAAGDAGMPALEVGGAIGQALLRRAAPAGGVAALVIAAIALLARRRRGITVSVKFRG